MVVRYPMLPVAIVLLASLNLRMLQSKRQARTHSLLVCIMSSLSLAVFFVNVSQNTARLRGSCCRLASSVQSQNVYFHSEVSSLQWKLKFRNVWGQYKRVSTLWRCFGPPYKHLVFILRPLCTTSRRGLSVTLVFPAA